MVVATPPSLSSSINKNGLIYKEELTRRSEVTIMYMTMRAGKVINQDKLIILRCQLLGKRSKCTRVRLQEWWLSIRTENWGLEVSETICSFYLTFLIP